MRCRRCGEEIDENFERCPNCSISLSGPTGELPPIPKWEEGEAGKSPAVQTVVPAPGSLPLKNQTGWHALLQQDLSLRALFACGVAIVLLVGLILAGLYISNLPALSDRPVRAEKPLDNKALGMVQEFPSTTKGMTVKQRAEQFAKEQKADGYYWWAAPEKNSGQYAVIFTFVKDGKQQFAIWLVDFEKRRLKAGNPLAESFSGI